MTIIKSCCCCRSLRKGCYAASIYTLGYFTITIVTMGHFIEVEQRYLSGAMLEPESESFLEPSKITPNPHPTEDLNAKYEDIDRHNVTVALNITLLGSSLIGIVSCVLLIFGVYRDMKYLLLPWVFAMILETTVEIINLVYLGYLQTMNFNPITSFLFTLDFFIISLNLYALICVISQFQEYLQGRGTATYDAEDRQMVQYTATAQTLTTSSAVSGRRRSAGRPMPSRHDPEEFSEAPSMAPPPSLLTKPARSNVKKHVQFPDEQSCIPEYTDTEAQATAIEEENPDNRVISSIWLEIEADAPLPDR